MIDNRKNLQPEIAYTSILQGTISEIERWESQNGISAYFSFPKVFQLNDSKALPTSHTDSSEFHPLRSLDRFGDNLLERTADLIITLTDATTGTYNGKESGQALEEFVTAGLEPFRKEDITFMVRRWIINKSKQENRKIRHHEIFGLFLDTENGNITNAIRDTMLFFNAEFRPAGNVNVDHEQIAERLAFYKDILEPIDTSRPFPEVKNPESSDEDLYNRFGEYYHQYWLLFLLNKYPPSFVKGLLSIEYLRFGHEHGQIKKGQDDQLVEDYVRLRKEFLQSRPKSEKPNSPPTSLLESILDDTGIFTYFEDSDQLKIEDSNWYKARTFTSIGEKFLHINFRFDRVHRTLYIEDMQELNFDSENTGQLQILSKVNNMDAVRIMQEFTARYMPDVTEYEIVYNFEP